MVRFCVVLAAIVGMFVFFGGQPADPAEAAPWAIYIDDLQVTGDPNGVGFFRGGPDVPCPTAGSNTKTWTWRYQTNCNPPYGCPYAGHYRYTYNCGPNTSACSLFSPPCNWNDHDCNYVRWRPNLPYTKNYRVCAYVPPDHAYTTSARYQIHHAGGVSQVVMNQQQRVAWNDLGVYTFAAGTSSYVQLGDYTAESYATRQIGFDGVSWIPDGDSCCPGGGVDCTATWPTFTGCPAPGAGSSRQPLFQQAYDRKGGASVVGCAFSGTYWWNGFVRQDFESPLGGQVAILHDEGWDSPIYSVPAWVVWGGIRNCYVGSYSSLGPVMSDEFINASGQAQVNFRYGYIWWDANGCHPVNWPNSWLFLKPGQDTNAVNYIEPVTVGSPGSTLPIPGVKLSVDGNGGANNFVDHPWVARDVTPNVNVTAASVLHWTQFDLAYSLHVTLGVMGADGVDRWIKYSANAPSLSSELGWVDMTGEPSGFNTWLSYTRNIHSDYLAEYGVAPTSVHHVHVGHITSDDWDGDHGGTVGGLLLDQDGDADLIADTFDNCPNASNSGQQNAVHPSTAIGDHCEDPEPDDVFDSSDNCPNVANTNQLNADGDAWGDACDECPTFPTPWLVPPEDFDCDGFTGASEVFVTTDASDGCAATSAPNDEPTPDAWPVDFDDNRLVGLSDVLKLSAPFGSSAPGPPYSTRYDLSGNGQITLADVLQFSPFFGKTCTP